MNASNTILIAAVLKLVHEGYSLPDAERIVQQNAHDGYTSLRALSFVEPSVAHTYTRTA